MYIQDLEFPFTCLVTYPPVGEIQQDRDKGRSTLSRVSLVVFEGYLLARGLLVTRSFPRVCFISNWSKVTVSNLLRIHSCC